MCYDMMIYDDMYDMIWYLFTATGFPPGDMVGRLVQRQERDSYIQKQKQNTKQYKNTEYTKHKTNIKTLKQT
jgi:hypothetical protein